MSWTVYTYGGGDALYYIFIAVAKLFESALVESLIHLGALLGLIWAAVKSGIERDNHKNYVRWFMTYVFIITALVPASNKMSIHIRDTVSTSGKSVDNLPPGLVIPASFISSIGYAVTKQFEEVFSLPDRNYLKYHEYGTMFAAEVMSEFENITIQDPVLRENMEGYINNCIMYDVMIGNAYDITDLKTSNDIMNLIKTNTSNIRMFNYRDPAKGRSLKTCKEAITLLDTQLSNEKDLLTKRFPALSKNNSGDDILKALDSTFAFYSPSPNSSAESQLKQLLLINAFKRSPSSYAAVRAAQSQNTTWQLTGEMAKQTLPIIHALFQALIYATFPIIICLMFFPGGFKALGSYFGMMLWIELWAPLFAILNLIISVFASRSFPGSINIQNLENIVSSQSNYALAAASLGMLIPVLSYMIVKGGAGQFVHIASSLTGATNQGVGLAAQEVVSGNRSMDNVSIANRSRNNLNANKFDTSTNIDVSSAVKEKMPDGTVKTGLAGGNIYESGAGKTESSSSTNVYINEDIRESQQKAYQDQKSVLEGAMQEYSKVTQSTERHAIDYLSTMARHQAEGKIYDINNSTEAGRALTAVLSKIHDLKENHGYSWSQAAEGALSGNLGAGVHAGVKFGVTSQTEEPNTKVKLEDIKPDLASQNEQPDTKVKLDDVTNTDQKLKEIPVKTEKGFSVGSKEGVPIKNEVSVGAGAQAHAGLGASGKASALNQDTQSLNESTTISNNKQTSDNFSAVSKMSKSVTFNENDAEEKRLSDNFSNSYENFKSQRDNVSKQQSRLNQFNTNISKSHDHTFTVGSNQYHNLVRFIASKPDSRFPSTNIGDSQAIRIIAKGGPEYQKHVGDFKDSIFYQGRNNVTDTLNAKETEINNKTNFNTEELIQNYKPEDGTKVVKDKFRNEHFKDFEVNGQNVKDTVNAREQVVNDKINTQQSESKNTENELRKKVNKAEKRKSFLGKLFYVKNPNVHSKKEEVVKKPVEEKND